MSFPWTAESALSLAPDANVAKAGQALSAPDNWITLGQNENGLWGTCRGTGPKPYETQIESQKPTFRCSCSSRKFPCKHALGLLLLFTAHPDKFTNNAPPSWILERRTDSTFKDKPTNDTTASEKRQASREAKIADGLHALEFWLRDMISQGLAAAHSRGYAHWDEIAARMVDAQAPGIARMIRKMGVTPSGENWEGRLLEHLAKIHLLAEAYRRRNDLSLELCADVRSLVGWTISQDELRMRPGVNDCWQVVGRRIVEEDRLRVQRTWLWGVETRRPALTLSFSPGPHIPFDTSLEVNRLVPAEIVFHPSSVPLRALLKERRGDEQAMQNACAGYANISDAIASYAAAVAKNPWIDRIPFLLHGVIPTPAAAGLSIYDADNCALPLARRFEHGWRLLAMSGGYPVDMFGEWNGDELWPTSVWSEGLFTNL